VAYTVEDAIAALASAQATQPADKVALIGASATITDSGSGPITGKGILWRTTLLGNLDPYAIWDVSTKFTMQRGSGPAFLLGLNIEPLVTIVGPMVFRPPAFAAPFLRRFSFLSRKRYQGDFGLYMQPQFGVVLTENQAIPKLTGTITSSTLTPGAIVPPGTVEVVLDSVVIRDIIG
jgi:hypothetical protein